MNKIAFIIFGICLFGTGFGNLLGHDISWIYANFWFAIFLIVNSINNLKKEQS